MDLEGLVLSSTRQIDFLGERGVKELSLPVYDPNRGRLPPRVVYALIQVIISVTDLEVYLHKNYYLSLG